MSTYRNDYREFQRESLWTLPRVLGLLFAAIVGFSVLGVVSGIVTLPGAIITKTLNPDNVIHNYEWFHDTNTAVQARVAQIKQQKTFLSDPTNSDAEKSKLRIELGAQQQSCRELVAKYNANATKTNRSIFMGQTAPTSLDPLDCE